MLQKQSKERNSSIELLRIIAMIMIVACHFATHGGFSFDNNYLSVPRLWWGFLKTGGNLGVDIFVLISGYFLVSDSGKVFNIKRILKFWGQVFLYSITIYIVFCAVGTHEFSLIPCIRAMFPVTFSSWWFASTYFVLYLIHPFLNMLLQKLDKKAYQTLIITQLILWCIIPTVTTSTYESNGLVWFVTLYCVAGYIRLFGLNQRFTAKGYLGFWLLFSALRYLSVVVLMALGKNFPLAAGNSLFFCNSRSVLTFLCALSLFMIFEKWSIGHIRWINIIASATFGVYLIHENNVVRYLLWNKVFKPAQYQNSAMLIPYSVIAIGVVYVSCTLIDLIRQRVVEKPFMMLVNRYSEKMVKPFEKALNGVKRVLFGKDI